MKELIEIIWNLPAITLIVLTGVIIFFGWVLKKCLRNEI